MDNKGKSKKYILVSLIPFALALFLVVYNAIGLILLNTTKLNFNNLKSSDIKSGAYINGDVNGEIVISYLKVNSKLKGGIMNLGEHYYYITSYANDPNKFISFMAGKKLEYQLAQYDDTMQIPADDAKIHVKGRVRKLEPYAQDGLRNLWKSMLFSNKDTEVEKMMNYYYIDTGSQDGYLIKIAAGILLGAVTLMLLLYKLSLLKESSKSKVFAYIAVPLLIVFIIIIFMNAQVIFTL